MEIKHINAQTLRINHINFTMADHQVLDEIVDDADEVVIQGRVSPSLPVSNR